jgi:NADH:ubiquinone oxidoreductase subunit F (NADH-binding)
MAKKVKSIITDGGFTVTDSNGTIVMQIRTSSSFSIADSCYGTPPGSPSSPCRRRYD